MNRRHAAIIAALIAVAVIAGGVCGWLFGEAMSSVAWVGELFLRALKTLIVPLIVAAVISSIASLGKMRSVGRMATLTLIYYTVTTLVAVSLGLVIVNLIEPGVGLAFSGGGPPPITGEDVSLGDIPLSLVSDNLVGAAGENELLPLIVFSIAFAIALVRIGDPGERVIEFFEGLNAAMMKLVGWIMYVAPVGIFALVAARLGRTGGGEAFFRELSAVGLYVAAVLIGLAIHFTLLTGCLLVVARRGLGYLAGMAGALLTALGTASSSATLPVTIDSASAQGIGKQPRNFVLPIGSTVNMDGTALYEAVAVMFIAQAHGVSLGLTEQVVVLITATLAAIGAAGIPEAGLVTMVIVLEAVGLPLEGIGLILAVDWFLDRFRTAVNVWGDAVGAAVIDRVTEPA